MRSQRRPARNTPRPQTGAERPSTGRPATAVSTNGDFSNYVVAVLEGRGNSCFFNYFHYAEAEHRQGVAREIGIAALDKTTGHCVLFQVSLPRIHAGIHR